MRNRLLVLDIKGETRVNSGQELSALLSRRYTGLLQRYDGAIPDRPFNHFWLSHDGYEFPQLGISVFGELTYLWYVPEDGHPGFNSAGDVPGIADDELLPFYISEYPADGISMPKDCVLDVARANAVAAEFFESSELPKSINWREL